MVGLRGAWVTVVIVLLVGVLTGCNDDPEPKIADPTDTPSTAVTSPSTTPSTPTPTPTGPVEPPMPAAAGENSDAGAEAFVGYYIDVFNFSESTGDTALLETLATDHCTACAGYVDAIRRTYDGGGRIEGGQLILGELRDLPAAFDADKGIYALGRSTKQKIFDASGQVVDSNPSSTFRLFAYPKWVDGVWRMHWMRTP